LERFRPLILLFCLALSAARLPGGEEGGGPGPEAREVFFTGEDLARAKARAGGPPWAARAYRAILAAADRWCARPYPLPEGPTGYYHDYVCPDHASPLRYHPDRSLDHACPVDGKTFRGPKLDAYWVSATIRNQLQPAAVLQKEHRRSCGGAEEPAASATHIPQIATSGP